MSPGPPKISFTEAELADMAGSLAAGATLAEVGARYGVGGGTVRNRLIDAGLYEPVRPNLRERERALIEGLIRDGWSVPAIAEYVGRSTPPIYRLVREYELDYVRRSGGGGIPGPRITNGHRARVKDTTRQAIIRAARRARGFADAAREAGVTTDTVERVLHEDAPVLLHRLRHPGPHAADALNNTVGWLAGLPARTKELELINETDYDHILEDYGTDYVQDLIDRLTADRAAAAQLRHRLRQALERQQARARREAGQ
jgi:transposase